MGKLIFDYNFVIEARLKCGISMKDINDYKDKVKKGFTKLNEMTGNDLVGFPKLPGKDVSSIKNFAKECKGKYNDLIVVGIGGSSLGLEAIVNAILPFGYNASGYSERGCFPRVWVADNADPSKINGILKNCKQEDTLVIVISKSGNTIETAANFSVIYDWLTQKTLSITKHIVVITDGLKGTMRDFADKNNLISFMIESSIGGRFSVLSPVGLVPAAVLGVDIDKLLEGASLINEEYQEQIITASAVYLYFMEHDKSINVLMPYSSRLCKFAEWFCQLWGESLGKRCTLDKKEIKFGSTPLRTIGATDQHSQIQLFREGPLDKIVTFIEVKTHDCDKVIKNEFHPDFSYLKGLRLGNLLNSELAATEAALLTSKVPSVKIEIETIDEYSLGMLFMFFQYVVSVIGLSVNIDPFDQPGVEEAKAYAYGMMNRPGFENKKIQFEEIYKKDERFII